MIEDRRDRQEGRVRVGISGWNYRGWRGDFYPNGLRQRDELAYAGRVFDTIEINGTFYSLQRPEFFARWRAATPDGFVFALKGSRFITHMKQLLDIETPLANFFAWACWRSKRSSARFCGSSRRASASTRNGSTGSSRCCRATPKPPPRSPAATTISPPAGR